MSINDELDPLSDRVYIVACELLKEKKEVTINDLLDVTDFSDSVIRTRLDLLAKFNKLGVAKGVGRRPSYYFLPDNSVSQLDADGVIKVLERKLELKQQEEDELIANLKIIQSAKNALRTSIEIIATYPTKP